METRVLISILDWGLGHATRSVPIIEALRQRNIPTVIAGAGQSLEYLSNRFPQHTVIIMPERALRYNRSGALWALVKRSLAQATINSAQNLFTEEAAQAHNITHLISDNVYGAYHPGIPSAIVTHQPAPIVPAFSGSVHRRFAAWLHRFDQVWVPDVEGEASLAGNLLQNKYFEGQLHYLGRLSRFDRGREAIKNIAVTALLSGPEPQRTILENKVIEACRGIEGTKVIIRGRPDCTDLIPDGDIRTIPFADGLELQNYLRRSEIVLARSGFSSLSDLITLGLNACVVPTPGQSEQIYLADRVEAKKWFARCGQGDLSADAILRAKNFTPPKVEKSRLEKVLDDFLNGTPQDHQGSPESEPTEGEDPR